MEVDECEAGHQEQTADGKEKKSIVERIKSLFSPQRRKKTIVLLAAAVVLIVVVVSIMSYLSPESTAERYVRAYTLDDLKTEQRINCYDSMALILADYEDEEEFFEDWSDTLDVDIENWNEFYRAFQADTEEELKDEYGDYKLTVEATRTKDVSNSRMERDYSSRMDKLEEDYEGFDRDDIRDMKEVTVKMKLEGEDYTERESYVVTLVKIHGLWKVLQFSYAN